MTHEEFAARHPHSPSPIQTEPVVDRQRETTADRQPSVPIDRRAPLTFRVQMPKIDNARIKALRPQPKPSANPPETTSTHSNDAPEPMEVYKAPMGRTLRKRKEKVAKHLKRGDNEKEMESFLKRVLRIPLEKPFEEAYFTHILWMFYRETKETKEDIRRMFHQVREKMKNRITLKKKKRDHGKFTIPCLVKGIEFPHALCDTGTSVIIVPRDMADQQGLKVEPSKESFTFVDSELELVSIAWKSFLMNSRSSVQHCGSEYETEYSASSETHTPTSIDSANRKSIDNHLEESIDSSPDDVIDDFPEGSIDNWENDYYNPTFAVATIDRDDLHTDAYDEDYEEEQAIKYQGIRAEEDRLIYHSYGIRNTTSIDRTITTSIDTHHHHTNRIRASTGITC
ncbi:hypothetical protein F2Q69_00035336 [Brassica cretica]|uniref:Aspartic peptidase DDI1-type domain-containing protein n=1 Tax=Brassica cretica TaxID=69181 RepID=A0A8S9SPP2_BRACR|nr:hypothetical protein F2Q69_00035336 [Brassica cretica]